MAIKPSYKENILEQSKVDTKINEYLDSKLDKKTVIDPNEMKQHISHASHNKTMEFAVDPQSSGVKDIQKKQELKINKTSILLYDNIPINLHLIVDIINDDNLKSAIPVIKELEPYRYLLGFFLNKDMEEDYQTSDRESELVKQLGEWFFMKNDTTHSYKFFIKNNQIIAIDEYYSNLKMKRSGIKNNLLYSWSEEKYLSSTQTLRYYLDGNELIGLYQTDLNSYHYIFHLNNDEYNISISQDLILSIKKNKGYSSWCKQFYGNEGNKIMKFDNNISITSYDENGNIATLF